MAAHHARTLALRPLCRIGVPHPRRGRVSAVPSTPLVAAKVAAKVSEGAKQQRLICRADMKSGVEIDGRIGARWEELVLELREWRTEGKLKVITPEEADLRWQSDGWVFVDVQTEKDFEKCHAIGSVNIPLFTPISGNSIMQLGRRFAFALNGDLEGTEENPELLEAFEVQCDMNKSTPLMVICSVGGELESDDNNKPYGVRSRSLITAHRLVRAGFDQVYWVDGGIRRWFREQRATTLTHDEIF